MFNVGKLSTLLDSIDSAANKTIHADGIAQTDYLCFDVSFNAMIMHLNVTDVDEEELPSVTRSKRRGDGGETATIVATSEVRIMVV